MNMIDQQFNEIFSRAKLSNRCVRVRLKTRSVGLTKRDKYATSVVQNAMGDNGFTALLKLFKGEGNPVKALISQVASVRAYVRKHTLADENDGVRLLPNRNYFEFTQAVGQLINDVEAAKKVLAQHYQMCVDDDIRARNAGHAGRATLDDYPTWDEFDQKVGFRLTYEPMPDESHFMLDLTDEDRAEFVRSLDDANKRARADCIARMLEPVSHLVAKLNVPIDSTDADGKKVGIFRDSALENIREGLDVAAKLNVFDDPAITAAIDGLRAALNGVDVEALRSVPEARNAAKDRLAEIEAQMAAFMS